MGIYRELTKQEKLDKLQNNLKSSDKKSENTLSASQAARIQGVTSKTLQKYHLNNKLKYNENNRVIIYDKSKVIDFIAKGDKTFNAITT